MNTRFARFLYLICDTDFVSEVPGPFVIMCTLPSYKTLSMWEYKNESQKKTLRTSFLTLLYNSSSIDSCGRTPTPLFPHGQVPAQEQCSGDTMMIQKAVSWVRGREDCQKHLTQVREDHIQSQFSSSQTVASFMTSWQSLASGHKAPDSR